MTGIDLFFSVTLIRNIKIKWMEERKKCLFAFDPHSHPRIFSISRGGHNLFITDYFRNKQKTS
jgi:hypothetical protein